MKCSEKRKKR
uniref:Uncharacterized protein n=1 Tax=Rhizophora mucronata TaxID=61149 RepID=A0A2P2N854_RHIMU